MNPNNNNNNSTPTNHNNNSNNNKKKHTNSTPSFHSTASTTPITKTSIYNYNKNTFQSMNNIQPTKKTKRSSSSLNNNNNTSRTNDNNNNIIIRTSNLNNNAKETSMMPPYQRGCFGKKQLIQLLQDSYITHSIRQLNDNINKQQQQSNSIHHHQDDVSCSTTISSTNSSSSIHNNDYHNNNRNHSIISSLSPSSFSSSTLAPLVIHTTTPNEAATSPSSPPNLSLLSTHPSSHPKFMIHDGGKNNTSNSDNSSSKVNMESYYHSPVNSINSTISQLSPLDTQQPLSIKNSETQLLHLHSTSSSSSSQTHLIATTPVPNVYKDDLFEQLKNSASNATTTTNTTTAAAVGFSASPKDAITATSAEINAKKNETTRNKKTKNTSKPTEKTTKKRKTCLEQTSSINLLNSNQSYLSISLPNQQQEQQQPLSASSAFEQPFFTLDSIGLPLAPITATIPADDVPSMIAKNLLLNKNMKQTTPKSSKIATISPTTPSSLTLSLFPDSVGAAGTGTNSNPTISTSTIMAKKPAIVTDDPFLMIPIDSTNDNNIHSLMMNYPFMIPDFKNTTPPVSATQKNTVSGPHLGESISKNNLHFLNPNTDNFLFQPSSSIFPCNFCMPSFGYKSELEDHEHQCHDS